MSATTAEGTPTRLPIADIYITDHNPRGDVDEESEAFLELVRSIEAEGILQPILVGRRDDTGYPVIAGHRRLVAATHAGISEIPVLQADVAPGETKARTAALAENLHRQNLTPLQEARALEDLRGGLGVTQLEAAEMLGKSERWARDREKLLELPDPVGAAFDTGAIAGQAVGPFVEIGKQAPKLAEAMAGLAQGVAEEAGPQFGNRARIPAAIDNLLREAEPLKDGKGRFGCVIDTDSRIGYEDLVQAGLPHDQLKAYKERFKKLTKRMQAAGWYSPEGWIELEDADVDAARAYGCLLELEGYDRWNEPTTMRWITDPVFLADRLDGAFERAEEKYKEPRKAAADTGKPADKKQQPTAEEREAREKARLEAAKRKEEAIAANLELGQQVARVFEAPKVTLEEAKLLGTLILTSHASGLGGPYAYVDRELQGHDDKHGCATYADGWEAAEKAWDALEACTSPEQVWGLLLRLIVGASYADSSVERLPSKRVEWEGPRYYGGTSESVESFDKRVAAIAHERKALPASIEKRIKRERREEKELEKRKDNQRRGAILEALAAGKKMKTAAQIATRTLSPAKRDTFSAYSPEEDVERLIKPMAGRAKQWVTVSEASPATYGITKLGRDALENLRAAERVAQAAEEAGA